MNKKKFILITLLTGISLVIFGSVALGEILKTNLPEMSAIYKNNSEKYTFHYPTAWHIYEINGMPYTRLENMDARLLESSSAEELSKYFKIEVVVLPAKGLTLSEWVEEQNTTSYPLPKVLEQKNMEVAGQPAIYQIEQFSSWIHPVVFISKGENIYLLNISSSDQTFVPIIENFIKNFEFN